MPVTLTSVALFIYLFRERVRNSSQTNPITCDHRAMSNYSDIGAVDVPVGSRQNYARVHADRHRYDDLRGSVRNVFLRDDQCTDVL